LVVTLQGALTLAEKALVRSPEGAAQVQEFHRRLFANSNAEMLLEIQRITGRQVRESIAEIETATGTVVHAFTTGTMVHVYLLAPGALPDVRVAGDSTDRLERAEDDGLPQPPKASPATG